MCKHISEFENPNLWFAHPNFWSNELKPKRALSPLLQQPSIHSFGLKKAPNGRLFAFFEDFSVIRATILQQFDFLNHYMGDSRAQRFDVVYLLLNIMIISCPRYFFCGFNCVHFSITWISVWKINLSAFSFYLPLQRNIVQIFFKGSVWIY